MGEVSVASGPKSVGTEDEKAAQPKEEEKEVTGPKSVGMEDEKAAQPKEEAKEVNVTSEPKSVGMEMRRQLSQRRKKSSVLPVGPNPSEWKMRRQLRQRRKKRRSVS